MTVVVGEQVQSGTGSWDGSPTSYAYQWQYSGNGVTLGGNVAGATRSDYITSDADIGLYFRCQVIATNAGGASAATYSDWVGPVGAYVPPGAEPTVLRTVTVLSGSTPAPPFPTLYARKKHHH